jgi:5'-3' exoribonuclease 1
MGIKYFFPWFKRTFPESVSNIDEKKHKIDHLYIDANGLIHEVAQMVYCYGKHTSMLARSITPTPAHEEMMVKCMTKELFRIINLIQPEMSVVISVDGVAPRGKQQQQRQRRFRAAHEARAARGGQKDQKKEEGGFDPNCLTAGTAFMKAITQGLKKMETCDFEPKYCDYSVSIQIVGQEIPGEGEHKIVDMIRKTTPSNEVHCIHGIDADLIVLGLGLVHFDHRIIVSRVSEFGSVFADLNAVVQEGKIKGIGVPDFIVITAMVGNDFLPSIPTFEMKEDVLDVLIEKVVEREVVRDGRIVVENVVSLFGEMVEHEEPTMRSRYAEEVKGKRYPNAMWLSDTTIEAYAEEYMKKFDGFNACSEYIRGLQWVHDYYLFGTYPPGGRGIPKGENEKGVSWSWLYPHQYAPLPRFFEKCDLVVDLTFEKDEPSTPENQLLRVLPPSSRHLLVGVVDDLELEKFDAQPCSFELDFSGKSSDWEAITIVDVI